MRLAETSTPPSPAREGLHRLAGLINTVESCGNTHDAAPVPMGWRSPSAIAPALPRSAIHEWFGPIDPTPDTPARSEPWAPALCLLTHLARQALAQNHNSGGAILWIGRRCRPYAPLLSGPTPASRALLNRSIFIDPPDDAARLWAIELALRSPASIAVIADGARLNMASSRRLQLAAKAASALALIARPPADLKELSAAATRWLVRREPSDSSGPRWAVELLRCKGVQPSLEEAPRHWVVEWNRAQSAVVVPAHVVDRSGEEERGRLRIA
jgi:hypothetical protein